jgi:hypothetical protein
MAKNNAYDEGLYLIGVESGGKTYFTEDGRHILSEISKNRKNKPEEVYDVIGGISDAFDAKGYPKDANINVVKQIKFGPFLITIQRRQK